jgi:hypothetical protein
MGQINYSAFRPMDLLFYEVKTFFGKEKRIGIVVALFEDLFVIEVSDKGTKLRHLEEIKVLNARRKWEYDSSSCSYVAQSILVNDLGREKIGDNNNQYRIAKEMSKTHTSGQYIILVNSLAGVSFNNVPEDITIKYLLSRESGLNKIWFKKEA